MYELHFEAHKALPRLIFSMHVLLWKLKNSKLRLDSAYRMKISKPFKRLILLD